MYLSNEIVEKVFSSLRTIHGNEDVSKQGATQRVSFLRYFFALDSYVKQHGDPLNTEEGEARAIFIANVGNVVKLNEENEYTVNFAYKTKQSLNYNVGSNFFSVNANVQSKVAPQKNIYFPTRKRGTELITIRNGRMSIHPEAYEHLVYFIKDSRAKAPLCVWLSRYCSYTGRENKKQIRGRMLQYLREHYSDRLMEVLLDPAFDAYVNEILGDPPYFASGEPSIYLSREQEQKDTDPIRTQQPLQLIYFGAPGSGKSYRVQTRIAGEHEENVFRVTFHPDSDYASFVGCYKPIMAGDELRYEFTPQVFTLAYVQAWRNLQVAGVQGRGGGENVYLVVEEINRGNCAQIFGDCFQLLDRDRRGYSSYAVKADRDLAQYLARELGADHEGIAGGNLRLPPNLNILATMNTSDQSLFPMDSAFKRRWDWEYVPIEYGERDAQGEPLASAGFTITLGEVRYRWVDFLQRVNARILDVTDSEDKQMGTFFIKGSVEAREFMSKVMFYLWQEVCKEEYRTQNNFFRYLEGGEEHEFSFNALHVVDGIRMLQGFMAYLGVEPMESLEEDAAGDLTESD